MWYILVEIDGLPQIEKIEAALAERITAQLGRILAPPLFRFVGRRGGVAVFTAPSTGKNADRIGEQLKRAEGYLRSQPEVVESFSIVVRGDRDVQQLGSDPLLNDAVRFVYDVPEEDGLWCDEVAARKLFFASSLKEDRGFSLFISESAEIGRERAEYRELFEGFLPIEFLFEEFGPFLNGEEHGVFQIIGPKGSGKRSVVERLRADIQGNLFQLPWLEFSHDYPGYGVIEVLLRALDEDFIEKVSSYLDSNEERIWQSLRPLLPSQREALVETDGLLLLYLYICAYVRYMESMYYPPIITIFNIDAMPPSSFSLISSLVGRSFPGYGPLWIFTSATECDESSFPENRLGRVCPMESLLERVRSKGSSLPSNSTRFPFYAPFHGYILEKVFNYHPEGEESPTEILVEQLPTEERSILFSISLLPLEMERSRFEDLLSKTGMDQEDLARRLDRLAMYRLVHPDRPHLPLFPELYREKGSGDRELDALLVDEAAGFLQLPSRDEGSSISPMRAAWALEQMGRREEALEHYFRCAAQLIFTEKREELYTLSQKIEALLPRIRRGESVFRERLEGLKLHLALGEGNAEEASLRFEGLSPEHPEPKGEHESILYAKWVITRAEYLWRSRQYKEALTGAKDALLRFQDLSLPEWEVRAQLLLGKIMLSFQRVEEAVEYFHNAGQKSLSDIYYGLYCESAAFVVLTHVMLGDYSLALSYAEGAGQRAAEHGRRSWERYLGMIRGKLLFELGRYGEASLEFQHLLLLDRLYFQKERKERFSAWLSRCMMYQGYTKAALIRLSNLEESPEHLYFRAEAHLLNRDFEAALEMLEGAMEFEGEGDNFICPIPLLSMDGYESFENVVLKKPGSYDVLFQLIRSMRGFLLSRLGRMEEAEVEFETVLEAEKQVKMDPYRHLYYFYRTLSYENSEEAEELTKATYLSKAFQNLQKIAGRITDPSDRRSFLKENYWNSKLFNMSREHKLV